LYGNAAMRRRSLPTAAWASGWRTRVCFARLRPTGRAGRAQQHGRKEIRMSRMKEERDSPPPPSKGNTETAQGENQAPKARMPHERDESADSQAPDNASTRRMGQIAHDAAEDGQKDTTKGAELDATYHRVRQGKQDS
jgi:hypothetical protein